MGDTRTTGALARALAGELCAAVEAVSGHPLTVSDGPAPAGQGWRTPVTASGVLIGTLTCWIDHAGVVSIAKVMTGLDEAPDDAVVTDMLRNLWSQAASAIALAEDFQGLDVSVGQLSIGPAPESAVTLAVLDGGAPLGAIAVGGTVAAAATGARGTTAPAARGAAGALPGNLAALLDIDLPLVVRFARTEMSLRSLAQLGPGSMVDMGCSPDVPVQLLVGAQVVAEGEVVVVSGNYGVRITSLVSPADRLKAIEL